MATEYNTTSVLILSGVTTTAEESELVWTGVVSNGIETIDGAVTDNNDNAVLDKDIDTYNLVGFPALPGVTFSGFYLKFNGGKFAIYTEDITGTAFVPHNGELNSFPSAPTDAGSTDLYQDPLQDTIVCFTAGTSILTTDQKYVAVETLSVGQHITTSTGDSKQIKFIFKQHVENTELYFDKSAIMPVRIKQGALGADAPNADLLVSPSHAFFIDGNLVEAHALINGSSIYQETSWDGVLEYYHIELEDHDLIYAHNVVTETFIDNVSRATFDNHDDYLALFGAAEDMQELEYPRAKSSRQLPKALKQKLLNRAEILYPELIAKNAA